MSNNNAEMKQKEAKWNAYLKAHAAKNAKNIESIVGIDSNLAERNEIAALNAEAQAGLNAHAQRRKERNALIKRNTIRNRWNREKHYSWNVKPPGYYTNKNRAEQLKQQNAFMRTIGKKLGGKSRTRKSKSSSRRYR
jgi:hypothetical protein